MKYADQRAEIARLTAALQRIKDHSGKVCAEFETCEHNACQASFTAWSIADAALKGHTLESANAQALHELYGES